jgi:hypothetical protein
MTRVFTALGVAAAMLAVALPSATQAQQRPQAAPAQAQTQPARPAAPAAAPGTTAPEPSEIKLDESTTLKAAALEARISAVLANFALLQRQAQDMQQEMAKLLDERKGLITDAGKKATVEVKDSNEWAFDNKGQRYLKVRRNP